MWGREVIIAYLLTKHGHFLKLMERTLRQMLTEMSKEGPLQQRSGNSSPWMMGNAIHTAKRMCGILRDEGNISEQEYAEFDSILYQEAREVIEAHCEVVSGSNGDILITDYRAYPVEPPRYLSSSAQMWGTIQAYGTDVEKIALDNAVAAASHGAGFAEAFTGNLAPLDKVGMDYPRQGPGWRKSVDIILHGVMWR